MPNWKKGIHSDSSVFSIQVDVCIDSKGELYSQHGLKEDLDLKVAKSLPTSGLEQMSAALLNEAVRRESFVQLLISKQGNKDISEETLAENVEKFFNRQLQYLTPILVKDIWEQFQKQNPEHIEFIEIVQNLPTEEALDFIYDKIDQLCLDGNFNLISQILKEIRVEELDGDILLGFLTRTLPAKDEIPSYSNFYKKVVEIFKSRQEYEEDLFHGLE